MSAPALGTFTETAPADAGRALRAAAFDFGAALIVAMLVWPFPLVRLTLGMPWAVHVPLMAAWILLVYAAYLTASATAWGRTPCMYLADLGLAGRPRPFGVSASASWAAGWTIAIVPALLGARRLGDPLAGLPARFSGLTTVATAGDDG